jgi:hypothetical protein
MKKAALITMAIVISLVQATYAENYKYEDLKLTIDFTTLEKVSPEFEYDLMKITNKTGNIEVFVIYADDYEYELAADGIMMNMIYGGNLYSAAGRSITQFFVFLSYQRMDAGVIRMLGVRNDTSSLGFPTTFETKVIYCSDIGGDLEYKGFQVGFKYEENPTAPDANLIRFLLEQE